MILFLFALAGVVAAVVLNARRGEKFSLDEVTRIRGLWFPIAGVLLHGLFNWAPALALRYAGLLTCAGYLCIFCFLFLNRERKAPTIFMALGSLSNFSVIAANGFRMPVSPAALAMFPTMTPEALYAKKVNYFVAMNGAHLYPLGDVIPVPLGSWGGFASVGDLLLGVGVALFIVNVMTKRRQAQAAAA